MPKCQFFKIHTKDIQSREKSPFRQIHTQRVPWCAHNHSPAPLEIVTSLGGANTLQCGGLIENCPLTPELLADI
jgi:hypothetical protein